MSRVPSFALASVFAVCASMALAQETTTETTTETAAEAETTSEAEAPAAEGDNGLSMGQEVGAEPREPQVGERYLGTVHGDWVLRCVKTETGDDPCQLFQLLRDADGNSVAEMSLFKLPGGGQAVAGATIITPLETLLTEQITMSVDGGAARRYPFSFCSQVGCVSRIGLTNEDVNRFKRGAAGKMLIVPAGAPDQKVELTISLTGFTAGYAETSTLTQ